MAFLRNEGFELKSKDDYIILKKLLSILNNTIHNYEKAKKTVFNLRWLIREFRKSAEKFETMEISENKDIAKLQLSFCWAILLAFFSYTPFIKSEILLKLGTYLFQHLAKTGISQIKRISNYLLFLQKLDNKLGNSNMAV